jgi:predicted O-methyltransferase YrrM
VIRALKTWIVKSVFGSCYRPGHFYSTIPSIVDIRDYAFTLNHLKDLKEIDLNVDNQAILLDDLQDFYLDFEKMLLNPKTNYNRQNDFFVYSDAFYLYGIIRRFSPSKIIEVGSGHSSALMLDTIAQHFNQQIVTTFIDPNPERLYTILNQENLKNTKVLEEKIQVVDIEVFRELKKGDLLFIDSSHVGKFGSDLNHILFNVLPELTSGVIIHFHDILFPFEYPNEWLMKGVFWNEAYLLKAFLMNNEKYKILLFNHFLASNLSDKMEKTPELRNSGGSLYLTKN